VGKEKKNNKNDSGPPQSEAVRGQAVAGLRQLYESLLQGKNTILFRRQLR